MSRWRVRVAVGLAALVAAGTLHAQDTARVAAGDSASRDLPLSRSMTMLNAVTIRERQQFDIIRADLDHRRKLGFGYRIDSVQLTRLPGVGEAFTLPSVHVQWRQGQWSVYMTSTGAYEISRTGLSLSCVPAMWIDGQNADAELANTLTKDEIGLIEVFTSGAGAPLEYSTSNCGVVLIWRKRFISP